MRDLGIGCIGRVCSMQSEPFANESQVDDFILLPGDELEELPSSEPSITSPDTRRLEILPIPLEIAVVDEKEQAKLNYTTALATEMSSPETGVHVKTRKYLMKIYPDSFIGIRKSCPWH